MYYFVANLLSAVAINKVSKLQESGLPNLDCVQQPYEWILGAHCHLRKYP
jgi:hypothetical protein